METVYVATGNNGKYREMKPVFEDQNLDLVQIDADAPEIDAWDVEKVAERKLRDSRRVALEKGLVSEEDTVIVEDTGLYIEALDGFPGAESAFFARTAGVEKLISLLRDESDRSAYFRTAIGAFMEGDIKVFTGELHGRIPGSGRGDPHDSLPYNRFFVPEFSDETLAENPGLKEKEFHRRKAVKKFIDAYAED